MDATELFLSKLVDFKSQLSSHSSPDSTVSFLLFKDYLSKLYLWYNKLSITSQWDYNVYNTKNGHNLLNIIAPEFESDFIGLEYFRVNCLNDVVIDKSKYRGFEYIFIYYSIYWDIFKDYPRFEKFSDLPNPYEPIKKILFRGSHIYKGEMGTIEVDNLPVKSDISYRLPSLDDNFLNFIDEKIKRIDSANIPNQEETANFWKEFQKLEKND